MGGARLRRALACDWSMYLYNIFGRNASEDLIDILTRNSGFIKSGGVVHSFDGSLESARMFMDLGFHIGINGCSLKTEENLQVVKELPLDRMMIETDAPWCEIRPSHAGHKYLESKAFADIPTVKKEKWKPGAFVKSRNEPCFIRQVLEVICGVKEQDNIQEVAEIIYRNTMQTFFPWFIVMWILKIYQ